MAEAHVVPRSAVLRRERHGPVGQATSPRTKPTSAVTKLTDWAKKPGMWGGLVGGGLDGTGGVDVVDEPAADEKVVGLLAVVAVLPEGVDAVQPASKSKGSTAPEATASRPMSRT